MMQKFLILSLIFYISLFTIPVYAEENKEDDDSFKELINLLFALAGLSGVAGLFWGIYQYKESRNDARKDIFFTMTKEYDTSKKFYVAKKILDGWAYDYTKEKGLFLSPDGPFSLKTISWILSPQSFAGKAEFEKNYPEHFEGKTDEDKFYSWQLLRDNFDELFNFYERMKYLFINKRITYDELLYFQDFLEVVLKTPVIVEFLETYTYSFQKSFPVR